MKKIKWKESSGTARQEGKNSVNATYWASKELDLFCLNHHLLVCRRLLTADSGMLFSCSSEAAQIETGLVCNLGSDLGICLYKATQTFNLLHCHLFKTVRDHHLSRPTFLWTVPRAGRRTPKLLRVLSVLLPLSSLTP